MTKHLRSFQRNKICTKSVSRKHFPTNTKISFIDNSEITKFQRPNQSQRLYSLETLKIQKMSETTNIASQQSITNEKVTMKEIRKGRTILHKKISGNAPQANEKRNPSSIINILLVHGSCAGSEQYEALVSDLYKHVAQNMTAEDEYLELNCYLYDSLGCGKSKHNVSDWYAFSEKELAKDLEIVFHSMNQDASTAEDTKKKTYILAHSYGVSQVIKLLNELNDKKDKDDNSLAVDGIILIGGTLRDGPVSMGKGLFIFRLPLFILKWIQPKLTDAFVDAAYHPESEESLKEKGRTFSNQNDMAFVKAFYRQQTKSADSIDARNIKTNALVIHGENDGLIPLLNGKFVADCLPQSNFVVVPKTSHQVFEENPKFVAKLVFDFISKKEEIVS